MEHPPHSAMGAAPAADDRPRARAHATDASSGAAEPATDSAEPATLPVGADTPPSALASAPHFGSFLSTVRRSGLRVLRTLDAATLLRFAEQSLVLEEEVATGCLMIQGIALLEHFHKTNGISPLEWPEQATRTGQLSSGEGWLLGGAVDERESPHVVSEPTASLAMYLLLYPSTSPRLLQAAQCGAGSGGIGGRGGGPSLHWCTSPCCWCCCWSGGGEVGGQPSRRDLASWLCSSRVRGHGAPAERLCSGEWFAVQPLS
jgi:hypothetical protein